MERELKPFWEDDWWAPITKSLLADYEADARKANDKAGSFRRDSDAPVDDWDEDVVLAPGV